jgi:WD40 repeat protein
MADPANASGLAHAWSPDSSKITTNSAIWDVETGNLLLTFNPDEYLLTRMIWGENGLLTDGFGSIRVWDTNSGTQIFELQLDRGILGLDWHPTNGEITYSIDGLPPVTVDPFPGPICDPSFTIAGYSR